MAALTAEVGSAQPRPWGWQRSTENKRSRKATLAKGDVVILDNLAAHKRLAAEKIVRARGAWLLFLRPYSPDLSPIEPGWAKVKAYLRRVAARTVEALEQALAPALDSITAQDAAAFFRHCGYACPN